MEISKGSHVRVNVAPFIGAVMRCDESIPCEVLDIDGIQVLVRTEPPYRSVSMWVLSSWIDFHERGGGQELVSSLEDSSSGRLTHDRSARASIRQ